LLRFGALASARSLLIWDIERQFNAVIRTLFQQGSSKGLAVKMHGGLRCRPPGDDLRAGAQAP